MSRGRAAALSLAKGVGLLLWIGLGLLVVVILSATLPLPPAWFQHWWLDLTLSVAFMLLVILTRPRAIRWGSERYQLWRTDNPSRALASAACPPILYLRSFEFDRATGEGRRGLALALGLLRDATPTVEQEFVSVLSSFAPVLAIGRPGETVPPSGAALRFYVDHAHWQETVAAIVPLCQLVVWATGYTPGLQWEIAHLVARERPGQLLLWVHVHVGRRSRAERQAEWDRFLASCGRLFPVPLPEMVEGVRFLAFDDDWTPRPIPAAGRRLEWAEWRYLVNFNFTLRGVIPLLRSRFE